MDVKTAAAALEVDPKKFRQFLRSNAEKYQPPGAGGRYDLSGFTLEELRSAFDSWRKVSVPRISRSEPEDVDDCDAVDAQDELPALPMGASRDDVRRQANARVAKLEEMLKAKGLHLSQIREHPSWSKVSRPKTTRS
jgi:hypothetical protein